MATTHKYKMGQLLKVVAPLHLKGQRLYVIAQLHDLKGEPLYCLGERGQELIPDFAIEYFAVAVLNENLITPVGQLERRFVNAKKIKVLFLKALGLMLAQRGVVIKKSQAKALK